MANQNATLKDVVKKNSNKKVSGGPGDDSHKYCILGKRGKDVAVDVPVGITVIREDGKVVGELNEEGATCLAAGGGAGGSSGNSFIGQKGKSHTLVLDLKLIADVGLVGFPNAGKSTFLKAVSNAHPKIASYPCEYLLKLLNRSIFTTLFTPPVTTIQPQLGIIGYEDLRQISIADLPGLIEGAHANFGLGHKFLKHVERTRMLVVMVDICGFQLSPRHPKRNYLETIFALNKELELYDRSILDKPAILLLNKVDKEESAMELSRYESVLHNLEEGLEQCPEELRPEQAMKFERIIPISAKESDKIEYAKEVIRDVIDREAEQALLGDDDDDCREGKLAEFRNKNLVEKTSSILV